MCELYFQLLKYSVVPSYMYKIYSVVPSYMYVHIVYNDHIFSINVMFLSVVLL